MKREDIPGELKTVADTPAQIEKWIAADNEHVRREASLEDKNEFQLPSGRYNAERVLELLHKKPQEWEDDDYDFAGRVVNYAHRSAGIAEHHPHEKSDHHAEVKDTGMTKNEIARRNWGLPARPKA